MASDKSIRSKEAQVQITMDGIRLGTSMRKILDFKVDPEADIQKTRFTGEKRVTPDLDVKGYGFSFKTQAQDHTWWRSVWNRIQQAEEQGFEPPTITIAVVFSYRDGATTESITLYGKLVLKMDSFDLPDDYVSKSWSGYAQFCE